MDRAGAWLGIDTSPGALLMGAEIGAHHDGSAPVLGPPPGATMTVAMLQGQGPLELRPPDGAGPIALLASAWWLACDRRDAREPRS